MAGPIEEAWFSWQGTKKGLVQATGANPPTMMGGLSGGSGPNPINDSALLRALAHQLASLNELLLLEGPTDLAEAVMERLAPIEMALAMSGVAIDPERLSHSPAAVQFCGKVKGIADERRAARERLFNEKMRHIADSMSYGSLAASRIKDLSITSNMTV